MYNVAIFSCKKKKRRKAIKNQNERPDLRILGTKKKEKKAFEDKISENKPFFFISFLTRLKLKFLRP